MSSDKCVHLSNHHYAKDLGHFLYPTKFPGPPNPPLLQAITEFFSAALE